MFGMLVQVKRKLSLRSRIRAAIRRMMKIRCGLEIVRNWYRDRRHGAYLGGVVRSRHRELGAHSVQSVDYIELDRVFAVVHFDPEDVLVDVGCGKGRVLNYWLSMPGSNRLYGVELDENVARATAERLRRHSRITIVRGNVLDVLPADATLLFAYNPFDGSTMSRFMELLANRCAERPGLRFVYYNCVHSELFSADPRWHVQRIAGTREPTVLIAWREAPPMNSIDREGSLALSVPSPQQDLTVECSATTDAGAWDEQVERLGGSFFLSHAYVRYGAALRNNVAPLFIRIVQNGGACVGIAAGLRVTPRRWPFSHWCQEAVLYSVPATAGNDPRFQTECLAAVEKALAADGVFRVQVDGLACANTDTILAGRGLALLERYEFYLDLCADSEVVWQKLPSERRTKIRKATKSGVETREQNDAAGVAALWDLHNDAMGRLGLNASSAAGPRDAMRKLLVETGRARILVDYLEGQAASAIAFGVLGNRAWTFSAGSSLAGNRTGATAHVYWAMIERLCKEGFTQVNLGGVAAQADAKGEIKDGLYTFKKDFAATAIRQSAGTKVIGRTGNALWRGGQLLKRILTARGNR